MIGVSNSKEEDHLCREDDSTHIFSETYFGSV